MADSAQIGSLLILLEAQTAKMDEQIKQSKAHFSSFKDSVDLAKAALAGFAAFEGLKEVLDLTAQNEKAQVLLASQIKATGDASKLSLQQMQDLAEQTQQTTTYSHEQVESVEAQLTAFTNITGEQFKRTVGAVLDFATVTGRDASESVRTLGQAINNPISSMGRLTQAGISLDEATKAQIKSLQESGQLMAAQNLLLSMLEKSYGGAAAAARDDFAGALQGLKNDAQDLVEGEGGGLNAMTDAVKRFDDVIKDPSTKEGIQTLITGMMNLLAFVTKAAAGFADLGRDIGEFFAKIQGYSGNFDDQIHDLTGHIQQTQEALVRLKAVEGESEEVKQLEAQLADYQAKLVQVQEQQQRLTGKSAGPAVVQPTLGPLDTLNPLSLKANVSIGKMPDINPFGQVGQKSSPYDQMLQDQQQVIRIWQQNDPSKLLQSEIDKTNALIGTVANGEIFTAEDAKKHIQDLKDNFQKSTDQMSTFADQAARNIQNTLGKEMFSGFHDGVKGMLRDWAQMLLQMVEQIEAAQLLNHFFGSYDSSGNGSGQAGLSAVISKGLSSMFGGGKAGGGDVSAGSYYQVAENGPELYTDSSGNNFLLPSSNGWITPTSGLGSGAGGSVAVNIDARGAGPDETAKLLAMSGALENSIKAQVEHRLQRGGWPSPPRRTA